MKNEQMPRGKISQKQALISIGIIIGIVSLVLVLIIAAMKPERSVSNFCTVAVDEKNILKGGDASPADVAKVYKHLEMVAPRDISDDVTLVRKGYESISKDPTTSLDVGLGMSSSERKVGEYVKNNCSKF